MTISWKPVRRALEIAAAALVLLLLTQFHAAIVTTGLGLVAARTDTPTILVVSDGCGHRLDMPLPKDTAMAAPALELIPCDGALMGSVVQVVSTVPTGRNVSIFVNGAETGRTRSIGPVTRFEGVRLRTGENIIWVGERLQRPLRKTPGDADSGVVWTKRNFLGWIPLLEAGAAVRVTVKAPPPPLQRLGSWQTPQGPVTLYQGPPNGSLMGSPMAFGPAGLALDGPARPSAAAPESAEPTEAAAAALPENDTPKIARRMTLVRDPATGVIQARVAACLPRGNVLLSWAGASQMSAAEVFSRLTGLRIEPWRQTDAAFPPPRVWLQDTQAECVNLFADQRFPDSAIFGNRESTFLHMPGDELQLRGFEKTLTLDGVPVEPSVTLSGRLAQDGMAAPPDIAANYDGLVAAAEEASARMQAAMAPAKPKAEAKEQRQTIRTGLATAWDRFWTSMPSWFRALLVCIARAVPVALILVAMNLHTKDERREGQLDRPRGALAALLALVIAGSASPILAQLSALVLNVSGFDWVQWSERDGTPMSAGDIFAPVALAVVLMLLPLLRAYERIGEDPKMRQPMRRAVCAVISLALLAFAALMSLLQRAPWAASGRGPMEDGVLQDLLRWAPAIGVDPWQATLAWAVAGLLLLWAPLFWFFRAILPRGPLLLTALTSSLLIYFLPILGYLVEALRIYRWQVTGMVMPEGERVAVVTAVAAGLVVFAAVMVLLFAFREIVLALTPAGARAKVKGWASNTNTLMLGAALTAPRMFVFAADPAPASSSMVTFVLVFQSFALLMALFAPVAVIVAKQQGVKAGTRDAYLMGPKELAVLGAAYAAYLTLWMDTPLGVGIAVALGLYAFHRLILEPPDDLTLPGRQPAAGLAQKLIAYRVEKRMLDARRKGYEDRFGKGDCDLAELDAGRAEVAKLDAANAKRLGVGVSPDEAKRRVLEFGPGGDPPMNGLIGAVCGVIFATALQILPAFQNALSPGERTALLDMVVQSLLTNPTPPVIETSTGEVRTLSPMAVHAIQVPQSVTFVAELINSYFSWSVLGFLFGYCFHRIRGDDGFVKGATAGAATAVVLVVAKLLSSPDAEGMASLIGIVPLILFLLLLGVLVFDCRTVAKQGVTPTQLPEIYGGGTSIGYASLAGFLAVIQPVVATLKGLTGAK